MLIITPDWSKIPQWLIQKATMERLEREAKVKKETA